MVKRPGTDHYEPISWDQAFQLVATELHSLTSPNEAAFYTSGRTSNEAAFLHQLFVRQFGANHLPDCSNMCHESNGAAMNDAIGIGKGCVTLDDFEKTDALFTIGQNPGTNHPRMLTALEHAKKRGAKIVAINPLPETGSMRVVNPNPQEYLSNPFAFPTKMLLNHGTKLSDLWLPVRINGDIALFRGMMKEMLAEEDRRTGEIFDWDFIRQHTAGYEEFVAGLRATSWEEIMIGAFDPNSRTLLLGRVCKSCLIDNALSWR
jgi:anaerobic selenocysteine-containing dehydrogenase